MAKDGKPRLRFAPSPTGYLHIGGVRTALFNWLWARKLGGTFILRIEDTDRERSTEENEQIILRDMRWLGLDWDEGPEAGGEHGPYRQMDRLALYKEYADKLVAEGHAYRCYATKEELDAARAELKAKDPKAQFRYPGWWRDRSDWPDDKPYVIRMKMPRDGHTGYQDLVFGEQRVPNSAQQDVVLMRSDGVPLYNFGCVVDDITMGVTLVARGRDHMINTPVQVLLYRALGHEPPEYAHLPMMLGAKGAKLSKRHGAVSVGEYRDQGIVPSGLLNYLARFGWGFGDEEIFSMDELIEKFDWSGCNRSDGRFDPAKLSAIAFEHLKDPRLTSDEDYLAKLGPKVSERYGEVDDKLLAVALPLIRPRAKTVLDAVDALAFLLEEEPAFDEKAEKKFLRSERAEPLGPLRALLAEHDDFGAEALEQLIKDWAEREERKLGSVAQPARVALTGKTASPGLFDVMALLGKERTLARLDRGIRIAKEQ
jgi:glutamyl-tRNA synthetase